MPLSPDNTQALSRRAMIAILAAIALAYALTLFVFYPGVMTFDARYVYEDIAKDFLGDWQSPVMTVLWRLIDPIAPGSGSILLLIVTLYWLAFGLLALNLARHSIWPALMLLLLALSPPAFVFLGIIWRDVLFAALWLLAAALVFSASGKALRVATQAIALGLLALGVLLRPNAIFAAPLLAGYILWPQQFLAKRAAIVFIPAAIGFYALVQVVYYNALGATRQHPLHSIMVFDLGGITHFAKENQFPVTWSVAQTAQLTTDCYKPTEWNIYWTHEPCLFVMQRLEDDKLFGTPAIPAAWKQAVMKHPLAYLQHRAAFMWNFLAHENFTMWTQDLDEQDKLVFADRAAFTTLREMHDALKPTPLFRAGTWLLLCIAVCAGAWRRRDTPAGAFAIGICGSAVIYMLTFLPVGVASDFRYAYWAVIAGIAGTVTIAPLAFRKT